MIITYLIALGLGSATVGVLNYLSKHRAPGEIESKYTLDMFRSKPINKMGDSGEYLGIDKVSYLLYKKEATALLNELNDKEYVAFSVNDSNPLVKEIKKKIKLMEYFESKYSYDALNK